YLPEPALEDVRRLLLVMQRLDRGRMVCTMHGVKAGDEIELSRDHVVTPFPTTHTIPSLGYVGWERRFKLKEGDHGLAGGEGRGLGGGEARAPAAGGRAGEAGGAAAGGADPRGPRPGGAGRFPAGVPGEGAHHRAELRAPEPPPREDPQVRPHAPGRLRRAGG